jgi:hypothetical protein
LKQDELINSCLIFKAITTISERLSLLLNNLRPTIPNVLVKKPIFADSKKCAKTSY